MTDVGATPSPERTPYEAQVLTSFYETEISANVGELQATTGIVLGLLAYLGATIFAIGDLSSRLLLILPLGVLFASAYQMLRAAVVVRRAALARAYELRLSELAGLREEFERGELGSTFYGEIDDIGVIVERKQSAWWVQIGVAALAYLGLYATSIVYTIVVLTLAWKGDSGSAADWAAALFYGAAWSVLGFSAVRNFRHADPATL